MAGVWVKDDKCPLVAFISGDTNSDLKLDIDEVWKYVCTKLISKTETNVATTHGSSNGWDGYASAEVTVAVALQNVVSSIVTSIVADLVDTAGTRPALMKDPVRIVGFPNTGFSPDIRNIFLDMWKKICNQEYN